MVIKRTRYQVTYRTTVKALRWRIARNEDTVEDEFDLQYGGEILNGPQSFMRQIRTLNQEMHVSDDESEDESEEESGDKPKEKWEIEADKMKKELLKVGMRMKLLCSPTSNMVTTYLCMNVPHF